VLESAVVAAPHTDFGEGVVAMLVANPGASIDIEAVKATVAENLAKFKQPKAYQVVPELPRNAMGKVQKNILREQVKNTFAT
jgi:malonyl-CoA/methylmalonyl-CoA synthetase